ncbi:peptidase [Micromonospora sp. KC721]|nr:peptidase [Micromonospora sp. KC721]
MSITVLDTYSAMKRIVLAPVADRIDLLRSMLEPTRGMYRYYPGEVDLVAMHREASGFPIDRDEARCLDALETLAAAGAWERMQRALDDAFAVLLEANPGLEAPDITVLFVLGDPGDEHFMGHCHGVTGFGGISGHIVITLWPFPENVERLEATAVHELNHNLRFGPGGIVWDPTTVTVGDHIVSEGLADAFARQLYGDELGHTRIGVPHLHDDEVFAKVLTGLDVTGMHNFTAWVHGDPSAERFGLRPVGLPMGAGYAAGNRLVDTYLAATGQTAAQALHAESSEIIATTLRCGAPKRHG